MDNITAVRHLIKSVHHKLHDEIRMLQDTLNSIDHQSGRHVDEWSHGLYTRLIERRRRMLERLAAETA